MAGVSVVKQPVVELVETHRADLDKLDHRSTTRPSDLRPDHRTAPSA